MSSTGVHKWALGTGLAAGAVMIGCGSAHADSSDLSDLLTQLSANAAAAGVTDTVTATDDPLGVAASNLTEGVKLLVAQLAADPTNNSLEQNVNIQEGSLNILQGPPSLQSNEELISGHSGPFANLADQLFFAPLNEQWQTSSATILSDDQAYADAIANGTGLQAAETALAFDSFQLIGPLWETASIDLISIPFHALPESADSVPFDFDAAPSGFDVF